jgi:protein-S-isoprenylcysteine O-methyltransferase Ste14
MKYLRAIIFCLSTIAIYLGLPLLGWGPGGFRDFFSGYSRAGYALIVLVFGLAVGFQAIDSPEGIRGSKGETGKLVRRQSAVRIVMILVLYAALIFLPYADYRQIGVWNENLLIRWCGMALCGLGYMLIFLSGAALGKQYSQEVTIQKDHKLITTGVFHYIRNPRYLGVMVVGVGLSLLFRMAFNPLSLLISVAPSFVISFRWHQLFQ